jgi:hypothetical protein
VQQHDGGGGRGVMPARRGVLLLSARSEGLNNMGVYQTQQAPCSRLHHLAPYQWLVGYHACVVPSARHMLTGWCVPCRADRGSI